MDRTSWPLIFFLSSFLPAAAVSGPTASLALHGCFVELMIKSLTTTKIHSTRFANTCCLICIFLLLQVSLDAGLISLMTRLINLSAVFCN